MERREEPEVDMKWVKDPVLVRSLRRVGFVLMGYNDGPACAQAFGPKGDGTDGIRVWVMARPKVK